MDIGRGRISKSDSESERKTHRQHKSHRAAAIDIDRPEWTMTVGSFRSSRVSVYASLRAKPTLTSEGSNLGGMASSVFE
jgi:hypothetical protein